MKGEIALLRKLEDAIRQHRRQYREDKPAIETLFKAFDILDDLDYLRGIGPEGPDKFDPRDVALLGGDPSL